ncbi:MAG: hypothetical protein DWP97_09175 [Calditrichaeota bacterium]|nr:MAG: hypothetical protein DWP97_09175 [Calditrichota bacterium]
MKSIICYFLVCLFLTFQALSASEIIYKEKLSSEGEFKSFTQLNIACGYRSDERSSLNHSPTFKATFYSMFSKYVGMKFGVGVNLSTKRNSQYYNNFEDIKEFRLESGFRFQNQVKTLAPFAELGFVFISYDGFLSERENNRTGIFIVFGIEYLAVENIGLEFSFQQIFNNAPNGVAFIPPLDDPYIFYHPPYNDMYFNPSSFNLGINFKFK